MMVRRVATLAVLAAALFATACQAHAEPTATWQDPAQGPARGGRGGGGEAHMQPAVAATPAAAAPAVGASPSPSSSAAPASAAPAGPSYFKTTGTNTVALTFDDGPDPKHTPQLLDMLREHGIKATFCLIGANVRQHPALVQAIVRDGHTLCNHTWGHDLKLGTRSAEAIRSDLQRTNDAIRQAVPGAQITYFRHPGGMWTETAVIVAHRLGMTSVGWEVDTDDWDMRRYGGGLKQHIISVVNNETKAGSIVLAHDGGGDRAATMAAFRELLPALKDRFTLAALPQ